MVRSKRLYSINNFYGGLHLADQPTALKPNQASYCNNAVLSKNKDVGAIEKIKGNKILHNLGEGIRGLKQVEYSNGATKIIAVTDTKIFNIKNDLENYDTIKTGLNSSTALSDIDIFNDNIIVGKNRNIPQTVSVSDAVADLSGFPPAGVTGYPNQIEPFKGRLFMSGNDVVPYEVYYCNLLDETTWVAIQNGGAGYFGLIGREPNKRLAAMGKDLLAVYTNKKLYILSGSAPPDTADSGQSYFYITEQLTKLKFNSPFSVTTTPESVQFFYNDHNIYAVAPTQKYGALENALVSRSITNRLMDVNKDYEHKIFSEYVGHGHNQIWWWLPMDDSTVNNQLIIYDLDSGGYYPCEDRTASCMTVLKNGTILTGDVDGNIRQELSGYNVDDTAYTFTWSTDWIDFENYVSISELNMQIRFGGDYTVYIDVFTEFDENNYRTVEVKSSGAMHVFDEALWDTGLFDRDLNINNFIEYVLGIHRVAKFRFREEEIDSSFRIMKMNLYKGA